MGTIDNPFYFAKLKVLLISKNDVFSGVSDYKSLYSVAAGLNDFAMGGGSFGWHRR